MTNLTLTLILRKSVIETDAICATAICKNFAAFCFHGRGGNAQVTDWIKLPDCSTGTNTALFLVKMAEETADIHWTIDLPEHALVGGIFPRGHLEVAMNAAYVTMKNDRSMSDFRTKVADDLQWNVAGLDEVR